MATPQPLRPKVYPLHNPGRPRWATFLAKAIVLTLMAFCGGMAAVYSDVYGRPISTVLLMLLTLFWAVFYLALQD
jgi:hypothetical protein